MVRCYLCKSSKIDDVLYGEMLQNKNMAVHTFCLYLSSNLAQNGADNEGFCGFLEVDIKKEAQRVSRLNCAYCRKPYANVGCCKPKCRHAFHFICGLENGAENRFCHSFMSYCNKHVRRHKTLPSLNVSCIICYENLRENTKFLNVNVIQAPCCRNGWFHKICLQRFAKTAGYFFKCPLCNDANVFRKDLPAMGIFIPNQDAAWELEPNAFAELLERPNECAANNCQCKQGRNHLSSNNPFVFCSTCGSTAMHKRCIPNRAARFHCADCTIAQGRVSGDGENDIEIDVCNVSDKEDIDIIRGLLPANETPAHITKQKVADEENAKLTSNDSNNLEIPTRRRSLSRQSDDSSSNDDKPSVSTARRQARTRRATSSSGTECVRSTTKIKSKKNILVDDDVEVMYEFSNSVRANRVSTSSDEVSPPKSKSKRTLRLSSDSDEHVKDIHKIRDSATFDIDNRLSISSDEVAQSKRKFNRSMRILSDDTDVEDVHNIRDSTKTDGENQYHANVIMDDEVEVIYEFPDRESFDKGNLASRSSDDVSPPKGKSKTTIRRLKDDEDVESISSDEVSPPKGKSKRSMRLLSVDLDADADTFIIPEKQRKLMSVDDKAKHSAQKKNESHISLKIESSDNKCKANTLAKNCEAKFRKTVNNNDTKIKSGIDIISKERDEEDLKSNASSDKDMKSKASRDKEPKLRNKLSLTLQRQYDKSQPSVGCKANHNISKSSKLKTQHSHTPIDDDSGDDDYVPGTLDTESYASGKQRDLDVAEIMSSEESDDDPLEIFTKLLAKQKNTSCIAQRTRKKSTYVENPQESLQTKEEPNAAVPSAVTSLANKTSSCQTPESRRSVKFVKPLPREEKKAELDISCIAKRTRRKSMSYDLGQVKEANSLESLCQPIANPLDKSCVAIRTPGRRKTMCGVTAVERKKQQQKSGQHERRHVQDAIGKTCNKITDKISVKTEMQQGNDRQHIQESNSKYCKNFTDDKKHSFEFSQVYEKECETDEESASHADAEHAKLKVLEISCIANRTRKRKCAKMQKILEEDENSSSSDSYKTASGDFKSYPYRTRKTSNSSENTENHYQDAVSTQYHYEKWPQQKFDAIYCQAKIHSRNKSSYYPNNQYHPHINNRRRV